MEKQFYVYEWYNTNTNEIFYVGKGSKQRYKDKTHRNQLFLDYVKNNEVDSRIVKYFDDEEESFAFEKELMEKYLEKGECICNVASGGYGGYSSVWTPELKEHWSEHNPMKSEDQRERMRLNNPMKNPDVAKKNGQLHKRAVVINGKYFEGGVDAALELNVCTNTIIQWCKRGYDTYGNPCRYADEEQKSYTFRKTCARQVQLGDKIYPSVKAAALSVGALDSSPLCKALKTGRKYHGMECRYVDQQPSQ